jgi:hypothetical protein
LAAYTGQEIKAGRIGSDNGDDDADIASPSPFQARVAVLRNPRQMIQPTETRSVGARARKNHPIRPSRSRASMQACEVAFTFG